MDSHESDPLHLLIQSLRSSEGPERVKAIGQIQKLRRIPLEVLTELLKVLRDPDPVVRLEAVLVFRQAGSDAIPVLVGALGSEEKELRRAAATTLGALGPVSEAAIPALQKALEDESIAIEASEALNKISPPRSWVRQLDQFFSLIMPVVLVLAIFLALVGLIYYVFNRAGPVVIDMAVGFCLIGGGFGAIMGGSRWGRRGAVLGALVLGFGGALIGAGIGYVAGSILGPVIQSLQIKKIA